MFPAVHYSYLEDVMYFVRCFFQMSKARRVGFIVSLFLLSQVVFLYLEDASLWNYSTNDGPAPTVVTKVMPGPAEDLVQHKYVVHRFYKTEGFGTEEVDPYDVTLAVHGSVDRLYQLIEIGEVWKGPISMSVFTPGVDASFFDDAVDGLRLCWSNLRQSVTFHAVYPVTAKANISNIGSFVYLSCKDIVRKLRRQAPVGFLNSKARYPHNVMRNVARSGVLTHYVLHIDSDIIPSPLLRRRFNELIRTLEKHTEERARHSLSLFVLPPFEVHQESELIQDAAQLITAVEDRNARPFLQEICPKCHHAVDFDRWKKFLSSTQEKQLKVSYTVAYEQNWEPFFVASRYSPLYDERVTSFGFDRLAHMCTLQAKGFKFHVLSDEFLIHRGYRTKAKITDLQKRRKSDRRNFHKNFVSSLKKLGYTDSKFNKCFR